MLQLSSRVRHLTVATAAFVLLLPALSARSDVDEIAISAIREDRGAGIGWFFQVEVEGSGLNSATVDIPGAPGRSEDLPDNDGFLEYSDPATTTGFASYAALLARNPDGIYTITVNDTAGTKVVALDWSPVAPVGQGSDQPFIVTTFPAPGATLGCGTPDARYDIDCANCSAFEADIVDTATFSNELSLLQFGGSFPAPVPFSDMTFEGGGASTPLADGGYEIEVLAGNLSVTDPVSFDSGPADTFLYVEEASVASVSQFTVTNAALDVQDILIGAIREEQTGGGQGWEFDVELQGANVCSVVVDIPGPSPRTVHLLGDGPNEFDLDEGPFATFADLQSSSPGGTYSFLVNEAYTVDLVWNPSEPVGATDQPSIVIDSPVDGAAGVSSTPNLDYTLDCANCPTFVVDVFGLESPVDCFTEDFSAPFPNPVLFSSLDQDDIGTACAPLADGEYEYEVVAGFLTETNQTLNGPAMSSDDFSYEEEASVLALSLFTVPEPGSAVLGVAALLPLAGLASRARRGRPRARRP